MYEATDDSGGTWAVKVLSGPEASVDRLKRFKNELFFCLRNKHKNILTIADYGTVEAKGTEAGSLGYVMPRYDSTLRTVIKGGGTPENLLHLYGQVLDGVEAAHLAGVIHRDIKPENILIDSTTMSVVIADFGIARFTEAELHTLVKTKATARLANFRYSAPEQREPGGTVDSRADIFALGLILNEFFTSQVIHGIGYTTIASKAPAYAFLDEVVGRMAHQDAAGRHSTIEAVKNDLAARNQAYISFQELSKLKNEVVTRPAVEDPMVIAPPKLVGVDYQGRSILLKLDRHVSGDWQRTFKGISGVSYYPGQGPRDIGFMGNTAVINEHDESRVQELVNMFKTFLTAANQAYEAQARQQAAAEEDRRRRELIAAQEEEDRRQRVLKNLQF